MKEIRFHDLRHILGTELNANGIDLKAIGEFLLHGNISTTEKYSHPGDRIKRNAASAYENLIHNGQDNKEKSQNQKSKRFVVKRKDTTKQMQEVNA
ncbi:MAG TPA: site-specific integrase [Clostridiaceae bacterium]|nr:site-specific integrase [Clostridiaceae bacterium]